MDFINEVQLITLAIQYGVRRELRNRRTDDFEDIVADARLTLLSEYNGNLREAVKGLELLKYEKTELRPHEKTHLQRLLFRSRAFNIARTEAQAWVRANTQEKLNRVCLREKTYDGDEAFTVDEQLSYLVQEEPSSGPTRYEVLAQVTKPALEIYKAKYPDNFKFILGYFDCKHKPGNRFTKAENKKAARILGQLKKSIISHPATEQ